MQNNTLGNIESIGFMALLILYFAGSIFFCIYAGAKKEKAGRS